MSTAETAVPETTSTPSGWSTFAAIMMMIAGVINGLWGWAALRDAEAWGDYRPIADATFMGPLEFWGWSAVIWAALMIVGSLLLFKGSEAGRIMGITLATFSAVLMIFVTNASSLPPPWLGWIALRVGKSLDLVYPVT